MEPSISLADAGITNAKSITIRVRDAQILVLQDNSVSTVQRMFGVKFLGYSDPEGNFPVWQSETNDPVNVGNVVESFEILGLPDNAELVDIAEFVYWRHFDPNPDNEKMFVLDKVTGGIFALEIPEPSTVVLLVGVGWVTILAQRFRWG